MLRSNKAKNIFLLAVLALAAFAFPSNTSADSSVVPGECPPVSFSANPSQGDSPLETTLTVDARDHLRCVTTKFWNPISPSLPVWDGAVFRATYIISSTPVGEKYIYTAPDLISIFC